MDNLKTISKFKAPYDRYVSIAYLPFNRDRICKIVGHIASGLGEFNIVGQSVARFVGDVSKDVAEKYWEKLPQINVILSYKTPNGWIASAQNFEQVSHLGLSSTVGFLIKPCDIEAQPFDVFTTSFDGINFWVKSSNKINKKYETMRDMYFPEGNRKYLLKKSSLIDGITTEDLHAFHLALLSWDTFYSKNHQSPLLMDRYRLTGKFEIPSNAVEISMKSMSKIKYDQFKPSQTTMAFI